MTARFRVLTANLLHGRSNPSAFARLVGEHDPDLVVVQELGPGPADVLASAYPHHHLRPALDFSGRGVASRLPGEFGDIDMPGRLGVGGSVPVGGTSVRIAGVHLLNPVNFPWWVTARRRGDQLDHLFRWIGGGVGPLLVLGDFNASPRWPAYKRMVHRLDDLVLDVGKPAPTWGYRPGWPKLLRIDHIFGVGVAATHVEAPLVEGSDHSAVVADIVVVDPA